MRILILLFVTISFFSCTEQSANTTKIKYYPVSIIELVDHFNSQLELKDSAIKLVVQQQSKEEKKIAKSMVLKDIESFKEFDINKAAWQNSYSIIKNSTYTRFNCIETKLSLKYIDIYGDINNPDRVVIYFQNINNLYHSSKMINWIPKKSYSIFSIQDVKGLAADTLFVKTIL